MNNPPSEKSETLVDHFPVALGVVAVEACLASYPAAMATFALVSSVTGKFVSLRNEKQVNELLKKLAKRIDQLDKDQELIKNQLVHNIGYQEVAHKRLLAISALDKDEDLKLSADLIALCGTLTGKNSQDKHLLRAIGDISIEELKLFLLVNTKRLRIQTLKNNFSFEEKRDAQIEREMIDKVSFELFEEGKNLLQIFNFTHLLGKIHSLGLIESPNISGFSDYSTTPKVYPQKLTPIGDYFIEKLHLIDLD